ncbi:MAG: LOG family protein [Chloroflexi bacterium]|nr:LOG family protein [Chloroflexota bacterium]
MSKPSPVVAVFGGSRPLPDSAEYAEAYLMGRLLAHKGFTVMNGGYAGTMEASARGARESGGRTIGVISAEFNWLTPNIYLDETVERDDLFARIREMHARADGFIVLKGSMGTLAELALVWNLSKLDERHRKPIILVGVGWKNVVQSFRENLAVTDEELALLRVEAQPEDAVEYLARTLRKERYPSPRAPSP